MRSRKYGPINRCHSVFCCGGNSPNLLACNVDGEVNFFDRLNRPAKQFCDRIPDGKYGIGDLDVSVDVIGKQTKNKIDNGFSYTLDGVPVLHHQDCTGDNGSDQDWDTK